MNDITSIEKFIPNHPLSQHETQNILFELVGLNGIVSVRVETDYVQLEYYQQYLPLDLIKDALVKGGFSFKREPKKKGFVDNFNLKLGEENNRLFRGSSPKCSGDTKNFNQNI